MKPKDATGYLVQRLQTEDGAHDHDTDGSQRACWGCSDLDCDPHVRHLRWQSLYRSRLHVSEMRVTSMQQSVKGKIDKHARCRPQATMRLKQEATASAPDFDVIDFIEHAEASSWTHRHTQTHTHTHTQKASQDVELAHWSQASSRRQWRSSLSITLETLFQFVTHLA